MAELRCKKCESVTELADECYECQIFLSRNGVFNVENVIEVKVPKEECNKGHRYTPENTLMQKNKGTYRRTCRECYKNYARAYWVRSGSEVRKRKLAERKQK